MYWGIYDVAKSKKLTLAIWDLDASVGQDWHCSTPLHPDYVLPNTDLGVKDVFNLYYRLSSLNVDNYNEKVASRRVQMVERLRYWRLSPELQVRNRIHQELDYQQIELSGYQPIPGFNQYLRNPSKGIPIHKNNL